VNKKSVKFNKKYFEAKEKIIDSTMTANYEP
jgi:hypothetical protein